MGLRLKLGLYTTLLVVTILGSVTMLRSQAERELLRNEMAARGEALLRSLAVPCTLALANHDIPALDAYLSQLSEGADTLNLAYMVVLDHEKKVIAHTKQGEYGKYYRDQLSVRATESNTTVFGPIRNPSTELLEVAVPLQKGLRWGTLRAGFTLKAVENQIQHRQTSLLVTGVATAISAIGIAYLLLSMLVLKPILKMGRMANRFGGGDLEARVTLRQKDEIGQLATQLNAMAGQIQSHTNSLEDLVKKRTRDLATANEQLLEANAMLENLAQTDPLTGMFNRRHFMGQLEKEIQRAERTGDRFSLLLVDVDHFKNYNDTNGHPAGDALHKQLTAIFAGSLRKTDLVARYGGEEFIFLLLDSSPKEGQKTAEKVRMAVENADMPGSKTQPGGRVTISGGMASYPSDGATASALIASADEALYEAKNAGRNRILPK